jgi:FkbM family methyltransferase
MVTMMKFLQEQYQVLDQDGQVPMGMAPRTTVADALVEQFCDIVEFLQAEIVLEVGAHEASFSQEMKRRLPDAVVWAFEANPHVYEKYKDRVHKSSSEILYEWRAVSDSEKELELFIPTSIQGIGRSLDNRMGSLNQLANPTAKGTVVRVPGGTLDGILNDFMGKTIALWIDVEGAVDRVLRGGKAVMRTTQVIMCEVESASIWTRQTKDVEILAEFQRLGFVPILRDCQSRVQYNVVLINEQYANNSTIIRMVQGFEEKVAGVLKLHFESRDKSV